MWWTQTKHETSVYLDSSVWTFTLEHVPLQPNQQLIKYLEAH